MTVGECEELIDDATPETPLVFAVPVRMLLDTMTELYGYGYNVGEATPRKEQSQPTSTANNTDAKSSTESTNASENAPAGRVKSTIVSILIHKFKIPAMSISMNSHFINDLGLDSLDCVEFVMEVEKEFNVAISDIELEGFHTLADAINHIQKLVGEEISTEPVLENAPSNIPKHYDVLIMSVKEGPIAQNWTEYSRVLDKNVQFSIIGFGNEPRELVNGNTSVIKNIGTIDYSNSGIGGVEENYALYDAIDAAIGSMYRKIDDPFNTDVSITIVTNTGIDYGSVHATKDSVSDLINKVKSKFGWSVNIMTNEGNAVDIASSLGIDSSNAINYCNASEAVLLAAHGRRKRNISLNNNNATAVNYFK